MIADSIFMCSCGDVVNSVWMLSDSVYKHQQVWGVRKFAGRLKPI